MFSIQVLGALHGATSNNALALAINQSGIIVGYSNANGNYHAALWHIFPSSKRSRSPLAIDLHDPQWPWHTSLAFSLNNSTEPDIVGGTVHLFDSPKGHAFLCQEPNSAKMFDLDPQAPQSPQAPKRKAFVTGIARGINDAGTVVGQLQVLIESQTQFGLSPLPSQAVYWASGPPLNLPTFGHPESRAAGINKHNIIVGQAGVDDDGLNFNGCIWSPSYGYPPSYKMAERLYPPTITTGPVIRKFGQSYAWAINDSSVVVGAYGNNIENHSSGFACLWDGSSIAIPLYGQSPQTLSWAFGINNCNQIVGSYWPDHTKLGRTDSYAFYWDPNTPGDPIDLFSLVQPSANSQWTKLITARGINDDGMVVGQGVFEGDLCAFVLTPIK